VDLVVVSPPQQVRCKLGETIEQPCSDVLTLTPEVCKGAHLYNGYLAWGMCTTSTDYKTVITVVLTIMSSMDPHMISGNLGRIGLVGLFPLARLILYSQLCGVIDVSLLRYWSLLR
jgi:hypothetical protein